MPIVDHELAWLDLKEFVLTKRSHGQDELFREMARIELTRLIPESQQGFDDRPARERPADERPPLAAAS